MVVFLHVWYTFTKGGNTWRYPHGPLMRVEEHLELDRNSLDIRNEYIDGIVSGIYAHGKLSEKEVDSHGRDAGR